jgi:hypothetical protein
VLIPSWLSVQLIKFVFPENLFLGVFANWEKPLSPFIISVPPSFRMEQLFSHWTDFYEIGGIFFRKSLQKTKDLLKYDKNNGYFTCRPMYIYNSISVNYSQNEKCFQTQVVEKIKIHILYSIIFSDPENLRLVAQCLKHYATPGQALLITKLFKSTNTKHCEW